MKIFLALFISLAYATEFPESKDGAIEKASTSRFDQLDSDTFYCIMIFLNAEEVLNLKILSQGIYRRVRNLWPKMELFTTVDIRHPSHSMGFSNIIKVIHEGKNLEDQVFTYSRAQLSCLREFIFRGRDVRNLQAIIDLLPKDSLTTLKLICTGDPRPLIGKIDFSKLIYLELEYFYLSDDTFSSLPNCIRFLKVAEGHINTIMSLSLTMALKSMDKLEVLSLLCCTLTTGSFSAILENLPTSLRRLEFTCVDLVSPNLDDKLSELGLKRLKEMECLYEIEFSMINNKVASEIILNLPKCVTNIVCDLGKKTLNALRQRSSELTNIKRIYFSYTPRNFFQIIQKIFPNLSGNDGCSIFKVYK